MTAETGLRGDGGRSVTGVEPVERLVTGRAEHGEQW